ncbi:MAG: CYTH and CHAD domain-containing protein [Alteromonadaceae bacterium]|nr:CYTH and CHAD domain-containing protein [Alteromonadaceae bacterium]
MATEIELKFLVNNEQNIEIKDEITKLLLSKKTASDNLTFVQLTRDLSNCYFDTPDKILRKQDIGLRVRASEGAIEQTIKTAGKVVGGLHQRPEYNVSIKNSFPDLSLFPDKIWQKNQNVDELQSKIVSIFNTDFCRTTWTISAGNHSEIELAYDQGTIESNGQITEICEIELELVQGEVNDLFELAEALFEILPLRPGIKSKAARGYALWQNIHIKIALTPLELIPLKSNCNIGQVFTSGLSFGLQQLQSFIDAYISTPSLAYLEKITEVLALLRHGFWLFEQHIPVELKQIRDELSHFIKLLTWVDSALYFQELTTKTGNYRKKIEMSEQLFSQLKLEKALFPHAEQVIEIIYSKRFNQLQISLLKLLLDEDKLESSSATENNSEQSVLAFAQNWLDTHLSNLVSALSNSKNLTTEQYLSHNTLLIRSLLTGSWFGDLFDKTERLEFRHPWLDIKQGISELNTLWILQQQLQTLNEVPKKLLNWQNSKVENLLIALEHSRSMALSLAPYWRA